MHAEGAMRVVLSLVCCLLILAGCAGKLPKTLPLSQDEEREAATLWSDFVTRKRPPSLDADIRLGWDVLGSKGGVAATLQVQRPALLRFAANDPLGRSLILVVADASTFTMVDNRIGHVYQGTIHSKFWHSYVPVSVAPEDIVPFLGGFLPEKDGQKAEPAQDKDGKGFWYRWSDGKGMRHHVLLDRRDGTMLRHLLVDGHDDTVLELQYAEYRMDTASGFTWPGHLQITGGAVTGTLTLQVEHIYSHASLGAATFRLVPPPHFKVEQMP